MSPDAGIPSLAKQMGERSSPPPQVNLASISTKKGNLVGNGASLHQQRLSSPFQVLDVQEHR
jgi:hypothetical protein